MLLISVRYSENVLISISINLIDIIIKIKPVLRRRVIIIEHNEDIKISCFIEKVNINEF